MLNPLMAADHTPREAIVPAPVWEVLVVFSSDRSCRLPATFYASQASAEAAAKEWCDRHRAVPNYVDGLYVKSWDSDFGTLTLRRHEVLP